MRSSVATATVQPKNPSRKLSATTNGGTKPAPTPIAETDYDRFFWTYTEEPHRTRRQAIIKAHPEVLQPSNTPEGRLDINNRYRLPNYADLNLSPNISSLLL